MIENLPLIVACAKLAPGFHYQIFSIFVTVDVLTCVLLFC